MTKMYFLPKIFQIFCTIGVLVLSLVNLSEASPTQCCIGDEKWIRDTRNCTNGKNVNLFCPNGFYEIQPRLEPEYDFRLVNMKNGTWINFNNNLDGLTSSNLISPENYCLAIAQEDLEHSALICLDINSEILFGINWKNIIFGVLSIISSFFFGLTLFIYVILPEMRDIQDKAIISATASFMVAYFVLGLQQVTAPPLDGAICLLLASLMYYAYLCAFFWLNIISFNIWRSVWFRHFLIPNKILFIIFCIFGWGIPLIFLAVTLIIPHIEEVPLKPRFGEISCWFNGIKEAWGFFYGPMSVLLVLNIIYLSLTCWKLWFEYRNINGNKLKVFRCKFILYLKLVLIMGITWIFEVLSFAFSPGTEIDKNFHWWILADIMNLLQGFIIFLVLVIGRRRVKKYLAIRKPCGISFPKLWNAYVDEENCEPPMPEELEFSQSS